MNLDFVAGINLPSVRAYVHKAGFKEVYHENVGEVEGYLMDIIRNSPVGLYGFDFNIVVMYGAQGKKVADLIGYKDLPSEDKWPGDPDISSWNIVNGNPIKSNFHTRSGTIIILGAEEIHRRECKNLVDFLDHPPHSLRKLFKD